MKINIPFNAWSKKRLREGKKCSTARTKIYGKVGDTFEVEGKRFEIVAIQEMPVDYLLKYHYNDEGAESPEELKRILNSIFRFSKIPDTLFLHLFEEGEVR